MPRGAQTLRKAPCAAAAVREFGGSAGAPVFGFPVRFGASPRRSRDGRPRGWPMFEDGLRAGVGTDIYEAATPSWVASHTGAKKGDGDPRPLTPW